MTRATTTKTKILAVFACLFILISTPRTMAAAQQQEPSFQAGFTPGKQTPLAIDNAVSNSSLDQVGHGLLILAIVSLLALKRRH